jgi:hypothetical protein
MTYCKGLMITELPARERRLAKKRIEGLVRMLHSCEEYLSRYSTGETNFGKVYGILYYTEEVLVETAIGLMKMQTAKRKAKTT